MTNNSIKDALKMIPYGFYSITSKYGDENNAMVANWITQVSFEPRLFAVGIQKTSYSHGLIEKGKVFAINLFNKTDVELIKPFTKGRSKNPDKMNDARFTPGPQTGCPVLRGAAAYIECRVVAIHDDGGDHSLFIGEVVGAGVNKPGDASETLSLPDLGWSYAG
ncbi:MAG: flavin reductase [Anaerolineales bacterium]|nr:flavin reductase [Anaerolineales bacterium]